MAQRMLIDATQPEETRVVVQSGNRIEDFDYETETRKQLKGNIYLAKVTRVEPSLQAAFVEYGGNRHGFLPFSEIHPDYYRIPIADREALIAEEASRNESDQVEAETESEDQDDQDEGAEVAEGDAEQPKADEQAAASGDSDDQADESDAPDDPKAGDDGEPDSNGDPSGEVREVATEIKVDMVGGDDVEDGARRRAQLLRRYKIQEVIKRRQVILIQVTKEERGNKGAALTTYLSLAGRYCVLMPNTAKGGGISRKISNANDRRRLKQVLSELQIPDGVAVIVRTAGAQRTKPEIRRDYEYLMRLWDQIRETTLQATAPALIHEEANLIKRSIRDLYSRDMEEILVEGEEGYKAARAFMKMLMPSHVRNVKQHKNGGVPLFNSYHVESQLEAMHSPTVQLPSGGYIVLNATEALVAIDVNSGKSTRERNIEETALRTNLEAAAEVGRQLRLRDLAGLIVIDFIDMEVTRHNRDVERKLKDALRNDRARIQLGRISPFGLLEMSRQRLRPSLFESSTSLCRHCQGTGHVRTTESSALQVLRALEEDAVRNGAGEIRLKVSQEVALYLFNQKRSRLVEIEAQHSLQIEIATEDGLANADFKLDRLGGGRGGDTRAAQEQGGSAARRQQQSDAEPSQERGRRRRRGRRSAEPTANDEAQASVADESVEADAARPEAKGEDDEPVKKRRRRGKRGGRRRSRRGEGDTVEAGASESADGQPADGAPQEAETGQTVTDQSQAAGDSPAAPAADAEETGEVKKPARRRRAPRPRKSATDEAPAAKAGESDAADGSASGENAVETASAEQQAAEGAANTAAESKPRGARRAGSPAKAPRERKPRTAAGDEKAPGSRGRKSADGGEDERATADKADENAAASPIPETNGGAAASSDPGTSAAPPASVLKETEGSEPEGPKRQGWWSRIIGS